MKPKISSLIRIFLWIVTLYMAGCVPFGSIHETPTALVLTSTPIFPKDETPTVLPFIGKVAFLSTGKLGDPNHIYVMNANGSELIDVTPPDLPTIADLSWSPDGKTLAFDAFKDNTIQTFKMKADGSDLVQLTLGKMGGSRPSWSPDGETILFTSSSPNIQDSSGDPVGQIYLMKPDGSDMRRFIVSTKADNTPMTGSYRRDGLISVSEPITRNSFTNYIVSVEGVIQKQFPKFVSGDYPIWSPDGKFYLFNSLRRDCSGIVITKSDGSGEKCLIIGTKTNPPVYSSDASWSPDGKYLIFTANLENNNHLGNIYVMKPDGSDLTRLTNLSAGTIGEAWSFLR